MGGERDPEAAAPALRAALPHGYRGQATIFLRRLTRLGPVNRGLGAPPHRRTRRRRALRAPADFTAAAPAAATWASWLVRLPNTPMPPTIVEDDPRASLDQVQTTHPEEPQRGPAAGDRVLHRLGGPPEVHRRRGLSRGDLDGSVLRVVQPVWQAQMTLLSTIARAMGQLFFVASASAGATAVSAGSSVRVAVSDQPWIARHTRSGLSGMSR